MDSPSPLALHPALLPPGTGVGAWRVQALVGQGAFGAVYRAGLRHNEHSCTVALKLALHPDDPRFAREGVLLSRGEHPSIPRLVDHGSWQSASGTLHPFLGCEEGCYPVGRRNFSRLLVRVRKYRRAGWVYR